VDGYFDHLLAWMDHANQEGFLRRANRDMILVDDDPAGLVQQFERYAAPSVEKWQA
jgi:predicted Rossmann-fold nucleotide-binding protein